MMSGTEFLDVFLQPFSFKPKAEGSAVAKSRPMNLVSRILLTAKKDPPQDSSDPNSIRNQKLDQSCVSSSGRKLTRRDEPSSSARASKLERGEDIQIGRSKMEFHNVLISDVDLP